MACMHGQHSQVFTLKLEPGLHPSSPDILWASFSQPRTLQAKDGLKEKGREYRQQLAEEKERRERNQWKKAAQAAHKNPLQTTLSVNQSHRTPLPDVIRPCCDHQDHETNNGGDNEEYHTGEEDDEEEMEENGPMSACEAALESKFTAPRDFERACPTQRHGNQHTIAASSPIPSCQRDRVTVPAGTATQSSPGPQGSSRETMGIAHSTHPHVSQHSIAACSSISSSQHKVVPDPPGGFRETTAITHRKSLASLEESSSEEDTALARGLKQPRAMSPNSDPESDTPGNQADEPVDEDTPAKNQPKCQCDRKGRARPRALDYEGLEQSVLKLAQAEFQVRVCIEYTFPEEQDVDIDTWAMACWDNACEHKAVKYEMSATHTSLPNTTDCGVRFNDLSQQRTLREALRRRRVHLRGCYQCPMAQQKKKSDGIVFGGAFNPILDPVIVLVFIAVEYMIKQWASGFLLDGLEQWRHLSTRTAQALACPQQRLYSFGCSRAGFHDVPE
ncbi:hypothetical protein JB92DRAFT_2834625 [Gautieria morchelliformis]|nr:hypothetical protein JB92DRAFT_2834625 [Gautieria morchelliformis]